MTVWTIDAVLALSPDSASAAAGQSLGSPRHWTGLGRSERALWGLCQGSGKNPYQARIDLSEPAFKCSCPSRKFPCKHGLGLLLLFAADAKQFPTAPQPGWVDEWLTSRQDRAEKKVEKAQTAPDKLVDLEAQAKRAAQREDRVREGVAHCRLWLDDLLRRGLATAQSSGDWDRVAARMVDAQAPGLATLIRRIPSAIAVSNQGETHWSARTLCLLGRLHMLLTAAQRLQELPADLAGDVRTALGWTQSKEEALASPPTADTWIVAGQITEEDEKLKLRRSWLIGKHSGARPLILDFAAGSQPLDTSIVVGSEFTGEVVFYPARLPQRALVKSRGDSVPLSGSIASGADPTIEAAFDRYAQALAACPWITQFPMILQNARLTRSRERWSLADNLGAALPLRPSFCRALQLWRLVTACKNGPLTVTLEWDGESALPIGAFDPTGRHFIDLAPRWAA